MSKDNCLPIADGGGLGSTADWTVPRAAHDQFSVLRKKFQVWVREWGLVSRLQKHVGISSTASLLTDDETTAVRSALCSFLQQQGFGCDVSVPPRQPFLLSLWRALVQLTGDIDSELPTILETGVPTGILQPVPCSGVWEPAVLTDAGDADDLPDLVRHLEPWGSAESDPTLVRELLQKDLDAGYLVAKKKLCAAGVQMWLPENLAWWWPQAASRGSSETGLSPGRTAAAELRRRFVFQVSRAYSVS